MISLNDSRSSREYPPSWISFICFKIVDLPDSPAPVSQISHLRIFPSGGSIDHTEKQHLDLVSLHQLVALELVLNFLVPRLPLLILGTHSATHFDGMKSQLTV
jgi:hypothetical protein